MAVDPLTPSRRMQSAAHAERRRVHRELARLDERIAGLERELEQLRDRHAELDNMRGMLDLFAHADGDELALIDTDAYEPNAQDRGDRGGADALRGSQIRAQAVKLLAASDRAHEAIHYRDWYRMLTDAGHAVSGKDPEATFLTQISRSPVIRRSTQAGVYELDYDFVPAVRTRLDILRQQLRSTHDLPHDANADAIERARERRFSLRDEIDDLERQLQEGLETLGEPQD